MAVMKEKKKPGPTPKPGGRTGTPKQFYLPDDLQRAIDAYIADTRPRPTGKAVVVTALEDFLAKTGHWPLKEGEST